MYQLSVNGKVISYKYASFRDANLQKLKMESEYYGMGGVNNIKILKLNSMARSQKKNSTATQVFFQKTTGAKNVWVKTFKTRAAAARAIKGITKKTSNKLQATRAAKGNKYGNAVKRRNGN